jgi:HK97 gp10 family phage protein
MADGNIDFKIQGLTEVQKMLDQLPDDVNQNITQDLMMKAGGIVKKEIQNSAPEGNNTKRNKNKLASKVAIVKTDNGGVTIGFKKSGFYAKFIEFGTSVRTTKGLGKYRAGANRGTMNAKPFVQRAHEAAAPKAVDFFSNNFAKLVNNSIKKQLKNIK